MTTKLDRAARKLAKAIEAGDASRITQAENEILDAEQKFKFAGYEFSSSQQGTVIPRQSINTKAPGDYGADPIGDGSFRMVPSGDIVNFEERNRRLKR